MQVTSRQKELRSRTQFLLERRSSYKEKRKGLARLNPDSFNQLFEVWKTLPADLRKAFPTFCKTYRNSTDPVTKYADKCFERKLKNIACGLETASSPILVRSSTKPNLVQREGFRNLKVAFRKKFSIEDILSPHEVIYSDEPISNQTPMFEAALSLVRATNKLAHKLYISDFKGALNNALLNSKKITAVLSLGELNKPLNFRKVDYLHIPLPDSDVSKFRTYSESAYSFIETKLKQGNVLVHCFYGNNRSCAVAVYFLMRKLGLSLEEARSLVKTSRPSCNISAAYLKELSKINDKLNSA